MDVSIAHPKIRQLPRSITVARNAHPSGVGKYVISLTQARFRTPGAKSHFKRLRYTGYPISSRMIFACPSNVSEDTIFFLCEGVILRFFPAVIAANTNLQYLTSQAYRNPSLFNVTKGLLNKGVPQSPFFERYAANFLIAKSLHGLSGVLHANERFLLVQRLQNRVCLT